MTIKVRRTGLRSFDFPEEIDQARIRVESGLVELVFTEPKGFGDSLFNVNINAGSFAILAQAMMHANAEEAIRAFGNALKDGMPEPRDVWIPP